MYFKYSVFFLSCSPLFITLYGGGLTLSGSLLFILAMYIHHSVIADDAVVAVLAVMLVVELGSRIYEFKRQSV